MRLIRPDSTDRTAIRRPAVAGSFYPADPAELAAIVDDQLAVGQPSAQTAAAVAGGLAAILVPHAGLFYSGPVAATGWALAAASPAGGDSRPAGPPERAEATIVLLGTNHGAAWIEGVGAWECGAWRTPLGDVEVDEDLASAIVGLGRPFVVDREAHVSEHSLEVQLPFLQRALPGVRIVPLTVATGRGAVALRAGQMLGSLLAARRARRGPLMIAISTDMAHYPPARTAIGITDDLAPLIVGIEPEALARRESEISRGAGDGVACGMCGIEPTLVGLAALRSMGVGRGLQLAAATSADAGGPAGRTVGYLAAAFPG
jgi:AmmeMemoRadiSam system protein B